MTTFEQNFRKSWILLTDILTQLHEFVRPWQTLLEYDILVRNFCIANDCKPAFLWYNGFPWALCTSVNDCLVHWIPDHYRVVEWDLIKLDVWIKLNWVYTDAAIAVVVWWWICNPAAQHLIDITKSALDAAVLAMKPWVSFFDIWKTISETVHSWWGSIVSSLSWHWVGKKIHDTPYVFNYPEKSAKSIKVRQWMSLAIEPITALWSKEYMTDKVNNRNLYTELGDLWCQWEYTVLVWQSTTEIIAGLI
jgi:methionyl aminopeptidase